MGKKLNLIGKRFTSLVVVSEHPKRINKGVAWECVCDCGTKTVVSGGSLTSKNTQSCGCFHKKRVSDSNSVQMLNKQFGRLRVLSQAKTKKQERYWKCLCECGATHTVKGASLRSGSTKSCGCLNKEGKDICGAVFGRWTVIESTNKRTGGNKIWKCSCICGNLGDVSYSNLQSGSSQSCGCRQKEMVRKECQKRVGHLHPRYNSELTDKDREDRRLVDGYNSWRHDVFLQDGHTCKICKETGGNLVAHHLDSWHWCVERRLDTENGVTLCFDCHKDFHKIYGLKENTAEEFFEYFLVRS
jgi:hypothetical protein